MFKKKILLLLLAVMIIMSVSSLANFLDVRRDIRNRHTLVNVTMASELLIINSSFGRFGQSLWMGATNGRVGLTNKSYADWKFSPKFNKTVEFWLFINQTTQTNDNTKFIFFNDSAGTDMIYIRYITGLSANVAQVNLSINFEGFSNIPSCPNDGCIITNKIVNDSQWHHIAITWYNTSAGGSNTKYIKVYFDGVSRYQTSTARGNESRLQHFGIGKMSASSKKFGIDEIRISNSSRYTANFTSPIGPFTADGINTTALYHFNIPALDIQRPRRYNLTNNLSATVAVFNRPYRFSVKWNDTNGGSPNNVTMVIFNTNITGTARNYTLIYNPIDSSHFFNVTNTTTVKDSRFYWRFYANDTNNNINRTDVFNGSVDETLPVLRIESIATQDVTPLLNVTITDNLGLSHCWYNITTTTEPGTCWVPGRCPTYFSCSIDPILSGINNGISYRAWIAANDTSDNRNITRAPIAQINWTVNLASGVGGGSGGGGGIRTSSLITELELSCGTRIFSFLYYSRPNKFSRDTICKNEGKSNLNAELEITEKLSKYVKAEFCDIDGLKCSNSISLFSGESGLLRIKAEIPRDFIFEDGFINIRSGSKINQFGVEIAPNIGYGVIGFISGLTGISDIVTIWILFISTLAIMILLFFFGGI